MIGEKISVNGKEYEIKKLITMGNYRKINQINSKVSELTGKYTDENTLMSLPLEERVKITSEFSKLTSDQTQVIVDFLADTLGLSQEDIDALSLPEAIDLFNKTFVETTQIKKKSEQPYG